METKKSLTPIYELELSDGISLKIHVKKAKKGILSIILFFAHKKAPLQICKGANFILLRFISQKYHSCFQAFRLGKF